MPGNFCSIPKAHFLHVLLADAPTDSEYVETMQSTQDDIDCAANVLEYLPEMNFHSRNL